MRRSRSTLLMMAAAFGIFLTSAKTPVISGQSNQNVKKFMKAKHDHVQKVLDGLLHAKFDKVKNGAKEMRLLSEVAKWNVIQTPKYVQHTADFQEAVDSLTKAAGQEKIDAAVKAYGQVIARCVSCHEHVRAVGVARLAPTDLSDRFAANAFQIRR